MAKWHFQIDGEEFGPVDVAVLRRVAASGRLKPEHKVRREDMAQWHDAKQVKGLFATAQTQATSSAASLTGRTPATAKDVGPPTPAPTTPVSHGHAKPHEAQQSPKLFDADVAVGQKAFNTSCGRAEFVDVFCLIEDVNREIERRQLIQQQPPNPNETAKELSNRLGQEKQQRFEFHMLLFKRNQALAKLGKSLREANGLHYHDKLITELAGAQAAIETDAKSRRIKRIAMIAGGGVLLLIPLVSAIITVSNSDFQKQMEVQKRTRAAQQLASFRPVRGGELSTINDVPPPIEEALAAGRKVLLLRDYRFVDSQTQNAYLVLNENGLDKVISVSPSGHWGEWARAPQPRDEKIPAYHAFAFRPSDKESVYTEYRKTGISGWDEIEATQHTRIRISPSIRDGSWTGKYESARKGTVVPKNSQFRSQKGENSGTAEILAK